MLVEAAYVVTLLVVVVFCKRQESTAADDRVADVESESLGDDEEAIAGGAKVEMAIREFGSEIAGKRPEWFIRGGTEEDVTGTGATDDGERWLASVVLEHELGGGGGTAP